jgi:guanylate kinase
MEKMSEFDYIVVNDKLEETIETVWSIVVAERHKIKKLDLDELKK